MAGRTYTSAIERLSELPEAFTGRDLTVKFQWTAAEASTYLANWRKAGLVRSLGGHSDAHANLVRNPRPSLELALRRVLPEATKVGVDILREAGWTTQIPSLPEVAVFSTSPTYALHDFLLTRRSPKWFALTRPGRDDPSGALQRLRPAWALADMIDRAGDRRVRDAWLLAPDDLDFDEIERAKDVGAALQAFGLPRGVANLGGYAEFFDETQRQRTHVSRDERGRNKRGG